MARPRSRRVPPRPSSEMEQLVAGLCGCLEGSVCLVPCHLSSSDPSDGHSLPIPWINVFFRAETTENANPNQNTANPQRTVDASTKNSSRNNSNAVSGTCTRGDGGGVLWPQTYEKLAAIRFLSLVACYPEYSWRGNPRFWWHVLNNICDSSRCSEFFSLPRAPRFGRREEVPSCAPARSATEIRVMPKFRLVFSDLKVNNTFLTLVADAFSPDPSESFRQVDQRTQELLARLRIGTPRPPQAVTINLNFSHSRLRMMNCASGIETLLKAASGRCGSTTSSTRVFFKVRCLDLSYTLVSERDLAPLAHILARPELSVSTLKLDRVFTSQTSKRFMRSFCEFVSACFAISLSGGGSDIPGTSLTTLSLNSSALNHFQLASIFSAIHEASSRRGVRELSLHGFEGSESWQWLAYGIFHPASKSQITHLDISYGVLRLEDVELVRDVLGSPDYGPCLMPKKPRKTHHDPHVSLNQWALVAAGSRLEIPRESSKHGNSRSRPALKLETESWCHVLESGTSWACVVVPAHGILYVKIKNIIKTEVRPDNGSTRRQLNKLTMIGVSTVPLLLSVDDEENIVGSLTSPPIDRVLSEWLQVVGQSLQTLHLRSNRFASRTLGAVLETCPLLTELDIGGCELTDIAPITRAYRRESCILRTLKAADNHISTASQEDLFRLLGDADCTAIRSLQSLHLEENPTSSSNRILNTLSSALFKNNTLRYLSMTTDQKDPRVNDAEYRLEKNHQGKWLGCEELPFECRLALLGIPMVKKLPTAIIEIIFDFARRDVYREILWCERVRT